MPTQTLRQVYSGTMKKGNHINYYHYNVTVKRETLLGLSLRTLRVRLPCNAQNGARELGAKVVALIAVAI